MENYKFSIRIKANKDETVKRLKKIVLADDAFRIVDREYKERPDLLIFELSENFDEEFESIQSHLVSNAGVEVFVTSEKKDSDLLLKAIKTGIKEFLAQPFDEMELRDALESFKKRKLQFAANEKASRPGQVINIIGAKGGVGTTTVAVNVAQLLAAKKSVGSVALVDLNTVFGEVALFLSVTPTYHWGHVAKNVNRLDSTFLINSMAKHPSGVHILPSPSYLNGHPPATPEIMERLLNAMKATFDFIIVDGGQYIDGPALKVIEMSDKVFLITLLSLPCLHNTNNLLKSLAGVGALRKDRVSLIVNRFLKKSDITIKEAEEHLRSEIFWSIPNDYKTTMSAINRGKALYEISPRAQITKNLEELSDTLINGGQKVEKKGWFFRR